MPPPHSSPSAPLTHHHAPFPPHSEVPLTHTLALPKRRLTTWRQARARIRDPADFTSIPLGLDAVAIKGLFSPGIKGAYINKDGSCAKGSWDSVGPRAAGYMVNHILDAIYTIAKVFCPKDPYGLVNAVFDSGSPKSKVSAEVSEHQKYTDWSKQALVQLLLQEHQKAKSTRRKQILSWVAATPVKRKWIKRLFDVSYRVIRTAQRHALMWSPGGRAIRLSLNKTTYHASARTAYLKRWLEANVECDPAGKNKGRRLRFLRRHSGHKLYLVDHERDVPELKPYSRSHFYQHPLQAGIQDTKCCGGLCTICTRWGVMIFIALEQLAIEITMLLKSIIEFDLVTWKQSFKRVQNHFVRGGMFQRNLKKSCNNVHCCLSFALSHPTDACYQHKCDHDHTEVSHTYTHSSHTHDVVVRVVDVGVDIIGDDGAVMGVVLVLTHSLSLTHSHFSHLRTLADGPNMSAARFVMGPTL